MIVALIRVVLLLCCALPVLLAPCRAEAVDPVAAAATVLAEEIVAAVGTDAVVIQLAADSFREQDSLRLLPFSTSFSMALAVALAARGVAVSVQEQREEPLRLLGTYLAGPDTVLVQAQLRQMGKTASVDLWGGRVTLNRKKLSPGLFNDSLQAAAESLLSQLSRQMPVVELANFAVAEALPLKEGHPTLRLGDTLTAAVSGAAQLSEPFGGKVIGTGLPRYHLFPRYEMQPDSVTIAIELLDDAGTYLAGSRTTVPREQIPDTLDQLLDTRGLAVCLTVLDAGRGGIKSGSFQAESLMSQVSQRMRQQMAIDSFPCEARAGSQRTVAMRFTLDSRRTADGYILNSGQLEAEVSEGSGVRLGRVNASGRLSGDMRKGGVDRLIAAVLSAEAVEHLGRAILVYRPDDDAPGRNHNR